MKPDVLIAWPIHCDYPLFRKNLIDWKDKLSQVIICFTYGSTDRNLEEFIRKNVNAVFVRPDNIYSDWRQNAITEMLKSSKSDYLLFLEQDFMVKDLKFFDIFGKHDFIGYKEGNRIHPAFAYIKRSLLQKTSQDFSAYPDKGFDHFGIFFKELQNYVDFKDLNEFGLKFRKDFYHMSGLTQNYHCFKLSQPFHKGKEFLTYNHYIQKLDIVKNQDFMSLIEGIERVFGKDEDLTIKRFFP